MTPRDAVTLRRWLWPVSAAVAEWLSHALHDQRAPDAALTGLTDDERMAASFIADHNGGHAGPHDLTSLRGFCGRLRYPIWDNPSGSGAWVVDTLQFDYGDTLHAHVCVSDTLVRRPIQVQPAEGPALLATSSREPSPETTFVPADPFAFIFDPDIEVGRRYVTTEEVYDNANVTVVDGPKFCDPVWTQPLGNPKTDIVASHAYRTTHGVYTLRRITRDEP